MKRFLRLSVLAFLAVAGVQAPARAQNLDVYNYNYPLLYQTQGRSYWGNDAQLGLTPANTYSYAWNLKDKEFGGFFEIETPSVDLGPLGEIPAISLGEFGLKGVITATGEVGFRYEANASGGSVDVSSPITVKVDYPKFTFDPNQTGKKEYFPVYVSYATNDNATIRSQSPDASFYAYLIARNFELRGNVTAKAFGESTSFKLFGNGFGPYTPKGFKLNPPNPNDPEQTLWNSFETTDDGTYQIFSSDILKNLITRQVPLEFEFPSKKGYANSILDPPFITTELQFPVITSEGSRSSLPNVGPNGLSSSGEDWFSDTTLNVTNLLTYVLHKAGIPVPPLNFNQSVDLGFGSASVNYNSFNVESNLTFGIKQDFNFVPKPTISLEYQNVGEANPTWKPLKFISPADLNAHKNDPPEVLNTFYNKENWTFGSTRTQVQALVEMPASRAVKIRPKVTFGNDFDHTVSLTATGGISATLLDINLSGEAGGYSLGELQFKPVDTVSTSATGAIQLKKIGPYALGGFDTAQKSGEDFQVIQQDVQLPQLESYTPTFANQKNTTFPICNVDENDLQPLLVQFKSAPDPKLNGQRPQWPADTRFFWDGSDVGISKNGTLQNGTVVVARIEPGKLTPGIHHIKVIANVMIGTGSGSVSVPVERTVDFSVRYTKPFGDGVYDPSISNEAEQKISQLPLNAGNKKLYITGNNMDIATMLFVNGKPVKLTASNGCSYIEFVLPAEFTKEGGTLQFNLVNPDFGGGLVSASDPINIYVPNPAPVVGSIALGSQENLFVQNGIRQQGAVTKLTVGDGEKQVVIHGEKFGRDSVGYVNGQPRPLAFVSDKELMVTFTAADLSTPGPKTVKIENPPVRLPDGTVVGGIQSGGVFEATVNVNNKSPKITQLSPGFGYQDAPPITLTINGSDFLQGAKVTYNGAERPVTFVSTTQLRIQLTAADMGNAGDNNVVVVSNPQPVAGPSDPAKFKITVPPPAPPEGIAVVPGDKQIRVVWQAVPGATSYIVKRAETAGGPYTDVAINIAETSYTDLNLANGKTYYYVVLAMNGNGTSAPSQEIQAIPGGVVPPPCNPGDVDISGGRPNVQDATLVLRHAVKIITLSGNAFRAGDLDKNGQVNVTDAVTILKIAVGLENAPTSCPN